MIKKHAISGNNLIPYDAKNNLFWLELISPTEEEIKLVINEYKIPSDYISDTKDPYELPRTEGLKDDKPDLFVLNYPIKIDEGVYKTRAMSIIISGDNVITVRNENSSVFHDLKTRLNFSDSFVKPTEKLLLDTAWSISKAFIDNVKAINQEIDDLEKKLRKSTKTQVLYDMIDLQKSLINFDTATRENMPVISSIIKLGTSKDNKPKNRLLKDLEKENKQAMVMIEKSSDFLEKLSDLYSNVISNNMNTIMKVLTSASIVMTVPTIIGGLWGMNTKLPMDSNPNAFWYLILMSIAISLLIVFILKKKDYL